MSRTARSGVASILRAWLMLAAGVTCIPASLVAQTPQPAMPDSVRDYVSVAMGAYRSYSVHRDAVDWEALEDSVFSRAANAQIPAETWGALNWALRSVDRHSLLMPPEGWMATMTGGMVSSAPPSTSRPIGRLVDVNLGHLTILPHSGRNRPAYVDSLRTQLLALDSAGVCGWIVDLRENTGGNMWPMLAGIGPLLGAEVVGNSIGSTQENKSWRYRDGRSWAGDSIAPAEPLGWGNTAVRPLMHADAPVALLVGSNTASSGELVVVAFLGRPLVRTFGSPTAGDASLNTTVTLRDGARMLVTSSYPVDRLGRTYPLQLAPDEEVLPSDGEHDPVLARAVAWLQEQDCSIRR